MSANIFMVFFEKSKCSLFQIERTYLHPQTKNILQIRRGVFYILPCENFFNQYPSFVNQIYRRGALPTDQRSPVYKILRKTKKGGRGAYHKAGFTCRETKGVRTIVRTPFHTSCSARYSVLHLIGVLSGGKEPPFYTREPFFMFIYGLSFFLTSTAFVGTKAKVCIGR